MVMGGAGRSVEDLLMLHLANSARPRLAHMLAQDVFHPAALYLELAGLAGAMSPYGSRSRRLGIPFDGDRLCLERDLKSEHWASLRDAPGFVIGVSGVLPSEPQENCY